MLPLLVVAQAQACCNQKQAHQSQLLHQSVFCLLLFKECRRLRLKSKTYVAFVLSHHTD
jgi:hypothetical protein